MVRIHSHGLEGHYGCSKGQTATPSAVLDRWLYIGLLSVVCSMVLTVAAVPLTPRKSLVAATGPSESQSWLVGAPSSPIQWLDWTVHVRTGFFTCLADFKFLGVYAGSTGIRGAVGQISSAVGSIASNSATSLLTTLGMSRVDMSSSDSQSRAL